MADITWTDSLPAPRSMALRLRSSTLAHTSPLTGQTQTVGLPGARWEALMDFPTLTRAQSAVLEALRAQLRGRANRLVVWNLARPSIRGVGGGTPLVNGASQTGSTINVDGLPNSTTGVWLPGDFIGIGGELKMVTASVDSNGSGQAAVAFEPPLRASPANDSAIVTSKPTARFMLADDAVEWLYQPARLVDAHSLDLIEAFT